MKVLLNKDIKFVGRMGDIVTVSSGFARNFLFPRQLATLATEKRVKEFEHIKRVAEVKKKKALVERQSVVEKINGTSVFFKMLAGDSDKLFGSITHADVAQELEKMGFVVDRRDVHIEAPIKHLGQHKAVVKFGDRMEATVQIVVERLT